MPSRSRRITLALAASLAAAAARADPVQNTPAVQTGLPAASGAPPAPSSAWADTVTLSGQIDAGIVVNPQDPANGVNFGRLLLDKANHPILNQLLLTAERDIAPAPDSYDFGFKLQGLYGSDARIVHLLGVFDQTIHDRNQIDILEANVDAHLPWLSTGGIDLKAGIYPSPLGFETVDPRTNPFYSHSYISNYGVPYQHLGILGIAHANGVLDLYLGLDSGANTSIGSGDDNSRPAGIAGLGLTLAGGRLTVLALTHIGPEDPVRSTPYGNTALRAYNDLVVTYRQTKALAFTTEINYVRDDGARAEGYGAAQYLAYTVSDQVTLNARAEIWRDNANFYVFTPVNNLDYTNAERGVPSNLYTAAAPTTYSEFTAGLIYQPPGLPTHAALRLRPELRYDRSLSATKPFDSGHDKGSFTLAADAILGF